MKYTFISIILALIITDMAMAQSNPPILKGNYLGQKPPGKYPEIFAPGILSSKYYEHSAPAFSPDGKSVFWTLILNRQTPARLMEMHQENGIWTKPSIAPFADTTADDFYPSFNVDGTVLYFSSRRKMPEGYPQPGRTLRIWKVEKNGTEWSNPMPLDTAVFQTEDYAHSISISGNIYTSFRKNNGRIFDIAVYEKTLHGYKKPFVLPYNINSTKSEDGVFVAPDEAYLIFESARPGGIGGSTDLYISFKDKMDNWSIAVNMGPTVNSKFTERFPRVSPDGKYLFFGSDRELKNQFPSYQGYSPAPQTGDEGTDIYWMDAGIINKIKKHVLGKKELPLTNQGILQSLYANDSSNIHPFLLEWSMIHPGDINGFIDLYAFLRSKNLYAAADNHLQTIHKNLLQQDDIKVEAAIVKCGLAQFEEAKEIISKLPSQGIENRFRFIHLASALYQMKLYIESAEIYQKALHIQESGGDFYNMACSYALAGDSNKAFNALNKAVDHGYNSKRDFEGDADLVSLKPDTRWSTLMKKLDAPFDTSTPYKRAHHEMIYDERSKSALMIGGSTPMNGGQWYKFFNDIWRFTASGWSKVGHAGDERSGIRMAYDNKRNQIYSYGGFTADNQPSGMLRVLENNEWKIISNQPDMKATEPGFVYDSERDRLIAFGGSGSRGVNESTWEWDGSEWKKFDGPGPEGRQAFVMVYDAKRKKTVVFGGIGTASDQQFGDTWEFDGLRWTRVSTIGPGPRLAPGFAYDSRRGMLILFGGFTKNGILGDTWAWDGSEWKKLADTGPAARGMGQMIYDKDRDRIVLFGGRLGPSDSDETWEWDGNKWMEIKK